MTPPAAPLAEISEAEATGSIAALYADIRATIAVPMVNLVFRNMATVPGCLAWAWAHLQPLYAAGLIESAAERLFKDPGLGGGLAMTADVVVATGASVDGVAAVGRAYARANPMNLIGLIVLRLLLDQSVAGQSERPRAVHAPAQRPPRPDPQLPPMVNLSAAPAEVRHRLDLLARQLHQGDNGVIPSLYRHFGHWPKLLDFLQDRIGLAIDTGDLFAAAHRLERAAEIEAKPIYLRCLVVDLPPPDAATAAGLRRLIATFPTNICRMTMIARALARLA